MKLTGGGCDQLLVLVLQLQLLDGELLDREIPPTLERQRVRGVEDRLDTLDADLIGEAARATGM